MKTSLWVVCAAVCGFALGSFLQRRWAQPPQLPTTTPALLGELQSDQSISPVVVPITPAIAERLKREAVSIQKDVATFRAELNVMEDGYRKRLEALLDDKQRAELKARPMETPKPVTRALPHDSPGEGDVLLTSPFAGEIPADGPPAILSPEMLRSIMELTFVSWSLENLRTELNLTDEQASQVRALLVERRERFLSLVDRLPPPSLRLLNIGRELGRRIPKAPAAPQ